jgi:bacillithiol biosynthesis deacetylase BshB1
MRNYLDILAFAAHPDDAELACGGTIIKESRNNHKTGIVDLTTGQLGTRGNPELRIEESNTAAKVMGLEVRENLGLEDGYFKNDRPTMLKIIESIRKHKPSIVLCNAISDRHPDHGRAYSLVKEACFYSGLAKIDTNQEVHRPKQVFSYIQDHYLTPDFIVDITNVFEAKMEAISCYSSQFYSPLDKEPKTPISSKDFIDFLEARAREFGRNIGVKYGEGFKSHLPLNAKSILDLA